MFFIYFPPIKIAGNKLQPCIMLYEYPTWSSKQTADHDRPHFILIGCTGQWCEMKKVGTLEPNWERGKEPKVCVPTGKKMKTWLKLVSLWKFAPEAFLPGCNFLNSLQKSSKQLTGLLNRTNEILWLSRSLWVPSPFPGRLQSGFASSPAHVWIMCILNAEISSLLQRSRDKASLYHHV